MNATGRLKAQVRAAQRLISQFQEGHGRHNSNLAAVGRDSEARASIDAVYAAGFRLRDGEVIHPLRQWRGHGLRHHFSQCQRGDFVLCKPSDLNMRWLNVPVQRESIIQDEMGNDSASIASTDYWQFE